MICMMLKDGVVYGSREHTLTGSVEYTYYFSKDIPQWKLTWSATNNKL